MGPSDGPVPTLAFEPAQLGNLQLRNRFIKAATFEGCCPEGIVTPTLVEHHRRIATGGAALTTVAYASVSPEGRSYATQLVMTPKVEGGLAELVDAVNGAGARVSLQVGHCGDFSDPRVTGTAPVGPSPRFDLYHLARSRTATESDLAGIRADFRRAGDIARRARVDALELHFGHGYLLSQFLSPSVNRRTDEYGGDLEGRLRFPMQCFHELRAGFRSGPILVKMNLEDGFPGGSGIDEAIGIARALQEAGADALVLSGGFVSREPFHMLRGEVPVGEMAANEPRTLHRLGLHLFGRLMVRPPPFFPGFFLGLASRVREAVDLPLVALGGIKSAETIAHALDSGMDFVGMGRALLYDPGFVRALEAGTSDRSPCEPCNRCVAEMDRGEVRCPVAPNT